MTGPLKPNDVTSVVKPDVVFDVFNEMILENWDGKQANVQQYEAAAKIAKRMDMDISELYEKRYMDIEESYRQSGWNVVYNNPWRDAYPAKPYFVFSKPALPAFYEDG